MEVGGGHQVMGMADLTGITIMPMGLVTFKRWQKLTVKRKNRSLNVSVLSYRIL